VSDEYTDGADGADQAEPEPITLSDDALVAYGDGDPLPVKDFLAKQREGLIDQAELTRMRQADREKMRQELEQEKARVAQEYALRLQQQATQGQQPTQQQQDILARLRAQAQQDNRDWMTFDDLSGYHSEVQQWAQQIMQRNQQLEDMVTMLAEQQRALNQGVTGVQGNYAQQQFDAMIEGIIQKSDLKNLSGDAAEMARELAKELAMSYVPEDGETPEQFMANMPGLIQEKMSGWMKVGDAIRSAKAEKAKNLDLPGSGGGAVPSLSGKPKTDINELVNQVRAARGKGPAV